MPNYLITVSGVGVVGQTGDYEYDFTTGLHGFTAVTNSQIGGKGLRATDSTGGRFEFLVMTDYFNVERIEIDWLKEGTFGVFRDIDLSYYSGGSQFGTTAMSPDIGLMQDTISVNVNAPNCNGLRWFIRDSGGATGALYVQKLRLYGTTVTGKPENSTILVESTVKGDALFRIEDGVATAWGGAGGIQFNGANVELANVSPSAYNPSHIYSFIANGTDSPWTFNFLDTDGNYTDNSGFLTVYIEELPS